MDTLLRRLREYQVVPDMLPADKKAILFERHNILNDRPIRIQDGDAFVELRPLKEKDKPPVSKSINALVDMAQTEVDFLNILKMVEALQSRGHRSLATKSHGHFIKGACDKGFPNVVIRALARSRRSGFTLARTETLRNVLWWMLHRPSLKAGTDAAASMAVLDQAQSLMGLLSRDEHVSADATLGHEGRPIKTNELPSVIGAILEVVVTSVAAGNDQQAMLHTFCGRYLDAAQVFVPSVRGTPAMRK
jgi:hypothetical protein